MNTNLFKRVLSLILCLVLLMGNVPLAVFAADEAAAAETVAPTEGQTQPLTSETEASTEPAQTTEPEKETEAEQTEPDCTGLADCPAQIHQDGCEKKQADEKAAADKAAADAVRALIEALPTLEEMQAKPMAEQQKDYEQVQAAYTAYCALSADQQAQLPPAEEVFKPYFDYFNELVSTIWSGSGTAAKPFLIYTEKELRDLAQQVKSGNTYSGVYFRLASDITLTSDWTPIGTETYKFRGTFDGNGKTISGMTVTGSHTGLFAYVGSGATIKNVNLTDFSVTGASYVAGLIAYADAGTGTITISDCSVNGSLRDNDDAYPDGYLAGIVAYADAGSGSITITGCTAAGSYTCDYYSGGIVGYGKGSSRSLKIKNCTNRAYIGVGNNGDSCGGIAGYLDSAELESCVNYGSVSGNPYSEDNGSSWLGGIAGSCSGTAFTGCGNYGNIRTFFAGGITPAQYGGSVIKSCLNVGDLTHSSDGYGYALIYSGTATNSYYLSGTGTGITGSTSATAEVMASGAVAHALREYFGQTIGVDAWPVPLTSANRVYKVTVVGEVSGTYYVNYGKTVALPELSSCAAYFIDDSKFDPTTPITRDYALAAKGYHNYVDGVCTYCGSEGVNYVDVGSCGDSVVWTLTEDGVLTVSGTGAMVNYSASNPAPWSEYATAIQSVVIDVGVTNVGDYAFKGLTNVTSVSIANTVTRIGKYAFNGLTNLTVVATGDSVTDIGDYAFASCTGITELTLGKQLKTIGAYAFSRCQSLNYVNIPGTVTTLGSGAFQGCTALEQISLNSGLKTIGSYALSETALSYLTIPETVEQIGDYAFANCAALTVVNFRGAAPQIASMAFSGDTVACHVPAYDSSWASNVQKNFGGTLTWSMGSGTCGSSVNWILDFNGTLTISGTGAMQNYYMSYGRSTAPWASLSQKILKVVITDGVTSIGDYAFATCSNLAYVSIADSVTKIGTVSIYTGYGCCFMDCTSLTQITIPKNVTTIAYSAFYGCSGLTAINVASGNTYFSSVNGILYDRYQNALHCYPAGKTGAFTVPTGVDEIVPYAFSTCDGLTEITIPSTVSSIGNYAFGYCDNLGHVTFTGSAPSISSYAFMRVTADVDFPTADTTWTPSMLKNYGGTLTWNAGTGSCGTGVQWELVYEGGYASLIISGTGAMSDYTADTIPWKNHIANIKTVEVCNGVTSVGAYALCMGNSSLAETSLTTVKLADSVASIGNNAFLFCGKLNTVTWSNGLKTIGDSAFSSTALTSITFPDSLETIGRNAFTYCYSLNSLTFGDKLKTIGYTAFGNCTALQNVDLGSSVTTLEQSAFNGCSKLPKIVIPASVTSVGKYAFRNCTNLLYVEFQGNAPTITSDAFNGTTCNAYYLSSKSGWTSSKLANYGGTVTWGALSQRGTCGNNAEWLLDTDGKLYICGSGTMKAYTETTYAPWYDYRTNVKKVSFRGVTSIGAYAFRGCNAITEVTVPSTITGIGKNAFADCAELQVVIFESSAPSFGTDAFSGTTCDIWYLSTASGWTNSVRKDYGGTLTWRSVKSKGDCGTKAKWALDSTGTLVLLGTGAIPTYSSSYRPWYSIRTEIKSVVVGGKVTTITDGAFSGCTALQTVTIGPAVTSISVTAFSGCSALTSVTFLGKAPSISYNAFSGVTATAYYPLTETTWTASKRGNYGGTLTWVAVCPGHKAAVAPAVSPTCTATGLTEGSYCSLCREVLVAQEVIPANGHYAIGPDGTAVPVDTLDADCLNAIVCTVCKKVAKEAAGHRVLGKVSVEVDPLTITNDASNPFTLTDGTYYSSNTAHSSSASLVITAQHGCTLTLNYGVSSEEDYDKLTIMQNGYTKSTVSGEVADKTLTLTLAAGDVVTVRYKKDGSMSEGDDRGWVKLVYGPVTVESDGDIPANSVEPDCTNAVVCRYCQTVVKEALGHRVIVQLPAPEIPYEVVNTSAYPFTLTDGVYYSGNTGRSSSTSELLVNIIADCTLTLNYGVSSEANYDKLTILLNGTSYQTISGIVSNQTATLNLSIGDVITVRYSKDSSVNKNDDRGWISLQYNSEPEEVIVPADTLEADCDGVTCNYCQTVVKEALGHNWDEGVVKTPATETAEGEMLYTCGRCGETKTEVIPALPHTHRHEAVITAPTCTEDGFTTHTCPCGDTYKDAPVAALGHDMSDWVTVTSVTCTEDGLRRKDCSRCDHFEEETILAAGHSYETIITPPTCTEDGFTTHTCPCGDTYTDTSVAALGHNMSDWVTVTSATCTGDGLQRKDCSRCDHFEEEVIPGGHKVENRICTKCGIYGTCGDEAIWNYDSATSTLTISGSGAMEDFTDVIVEEVPWTSFALQIQKLVIEEGITSIGSWTFVKCENIAELIIPNTVTSIGEFAFYDNCGLTELILPERLTRIGANAYAFCRNLKEVDIPESVKTIEINAFSLCNKLEKVTVGGNGTIIGEDAFAYDSNLTSVVIRNGVTTIKSEAFMCCDGLEEITIPASVTMIQNYAFAHDAALKRIMFEGNAPRFNGEIVFYEVVATACYPTGNETWTESVKKDYGGTITWQPYCYDEHSYETIITPPTCTEDGFTTHTCPCGDTYTDTPVAALGHDMSDWVTVTSVTCTEDGLRRKDCSRCDHFEEETILAAGHSYETIITPPTCTEDGFTTHTCPCGDTYTDASVAALGHDMSDWVTITSATCIGDGLQRKDCSRCDHFEEEAIPAAGHTHVNGICSVCGAPEGMDYTVADDGITISGSEGTGSDVVIPDEIAGKPVTGIDSAAFADRSDLTVIVIPESVTHIGENAFAGCDNLIDIYYGGTAEQWAALGKNAPKAAYIHYSCTDPTDHWKTETAAATCEEDGCTWQSCACGYERNRVVTETAFGHTEVTDEAVAPTCTATGLTEGKHCAVCSKVLLAQEVISANGHSFELRSEQIICAVCDEELKVQIDQDYVALDVLMLPKAQLALEVSPAHLADAVQWTIEGKEGIASVSQNGLVTACDEGTVHVIATLTYGEFEVSTRCRVDVTKLVQIEGIQLSSTKVTTQLYSTDYAGFEVLLQLPQNNTLTAAGIDVQEQHKGIAIEKAVFTDKTTAQLFDLLVLDDRTVRVVPTDYAVNNPKAVAGKYTSTVTVTVLGKEYVSENLTLTVKKTLPKLKATVAAFNSFYYGQSQSIVIKGATPISITADASKAAQNWLTLADDGSGKLTLNENAPTKSTSAKMYLLVDTEEWRIPAAVTLTVKNTYKAPGLKLSATSVTAAADHSDGIALKLLCTKKTDTLESLAVTGIKVPAGYSIENLNLTDGSFILKSDSGFKKDAVKLEVTFGNTKASKTLKLNVKTASITLTPSSRTVTLNRAVGDSTVVSFAATPKDFRIEDLDIRLTTSKGVDKLASGELTITEAGNQVTLTTTGLTPEKESYKLYVRAGGGKETVVTVNVVSAAPTVTFKAKGTLDLSFPENAVTVTPTFKNHSGKIVSHGYTVTEMKGKTVVKEDASKAFSVQQNGKTFEIKCIDETAVNTANTYIFKLKLILNDGNSVENTVSLKVKRTAVKLSLKVSGKLDVIRDGSTVTVTPSYRNCPKTAARMEELFIYSSADNFAKPVNELFEIVSNGKGGYVITKAEDAELNRSLKYKVKLVSTFEHTKAESSLTAMTVTMGSAKLTVQSDDTVLFAKDRNDRVVFRFKAGDALLNEVVKVEIKDAKYKNIFEVYDYGNGEFAIAYKDSVVSKILIGKKATTAVTLYLNVFIDGNESTKANTTVKLKLTVVK